MIWFPYFSSSSLVRGSNIYTIQRASKEDEGSYICKAKSSAGEIEEVLQIIVSEDSNIIEEVPYIIFEQLSSKSKLLELHTKFPVKGQVISEWNFGVLNFPKYQRKKLINFCPRI